MKITKQNPAVIVPPATVIIELTIEEAKDLAVIIGGTSSALRKKWMESSQAFDHLEGRIEGQHLSFCSLYTELSEVTQ